MRRKLTLLLFALAAVAPAAAISPTAAARVPFEPTSVTSCPSGQHLVVCPTRTFCCSDFAKCVCLPF